jgi:hypothetical protein
MLLICNTSYSEDRDLEAKLVRTPSQQQQQQKKIGMWEGCTYYSSYTGNIGRRIMVQGSPWIKCKILFVK